MVVSISYPHSGYASLDVTLLFASPDFSALLYLHACMQSPVDYLNALIAAQVSGPDAALCMVLHDTAVM